MADRTHRKERAVKVFYSDHFVLPLPEGHRFPMRKYAMLREKVERNGVCNPEELLVPRAVTDGEILRAHTPEYLKKVVHGELSEKEVRRIGFPWSEQMVERSRRASGGTLEACVAALEEGFAANLAGGTHHSFADRGEGFCILNDSAIALRALQAEGYVRRALVIDTDVHQGNGTAAIFSGDPLVFTFSIHGAKNFPFHKESGDLDVGLPDGADDEKYLTALEKGLERALEIPADLAIYLAGADPYEGDRLGKLSVSAEGLTERDRLVLEGCRSVSLPVALTMAGGYAEEIKNTVAVHFHSIKKASELQKREGVKTHG
jgi:acetoin utilization deacetylase AcuC-like enzyme